MTNRLPKSRTRADALTADERAREKIVTELERNFLVEAGAGSGKTTALVNRMIAHVRAGHPVESLAAVTFTRKAAAELAERFRERLEEERRSATGKGDQEAAVQLDRALEQIDRSFVGTIHAFCGRLLRERPLEAELDPSFVEVSGDDWTVLCDEYWRTWVHRLVAEEDAMMATVKELRVDPALLVGSFRTVVEYQDVTFPMPATKAPDSAQCVKQLRSLIARGMKLRPKTELTDGRDELQQLVWRLSYLDNTGDWDDGLPVFCEAIGAIRKSHFGKILKRWSADKTVQEQVKGLADDFQSLLESDIEPLLECWYEHRYKPVMEVLLRARADFERHRIETGQLGFGDLLSRAAALLARDDAARLELGERYRYLMVDEFQDTDPLQAEVCFLLASDPREGTDWRKVKPRAGGLFVVGDPKQSIYRFRRADIETYQLVKESMRKVGEVLELTRNFRSVPEIGEFVNAHFEKAFPRAATPMQAAFSPVIAEAAARGRPSVSAYAVGRARTKNDIYYDDAERLGSWIAERLRKEPGRRPEDFLILAWKKESILQLARSLASRNIPATVTGAEVTMETELEELLAALRALADPDNPVRVVAALQGLFVGASPADLFDAHVAGVRFSLLEDPGAASGIIADGIRMLRQWRELAQRTPVDTLIDTILDETGLLAYTTSGEIGDSRAGMLLRVGSVMRAAGVDADGSLSDAIDRIEATLGNDPEEATLRPGRTDAVRVMNLHQAKGLEAEIVVLASPYKPRTFPPATLHVERGAKGEASGKMVVCYKRGNDTTVIAQAPRWAEAAEVEEQFRAAERDRLRYVAATRAKQELHIAQLPPDGNGSTGIWDCFAESLKGLEEKNFAIAAAPGRALLEESADVIAGRIADAQARRAKAAVLLYEFRAVSHSAKAKVFDRAEGNGSEGPLAVGKGRPWGRAVHRVIEAMGLGRTGESLRMFAGAVAADELEAVGEEEHRLRVDRILAIAQSLAKKAEWRRLMSCQEKHFELSVTGRETEGGGQVVIEGVIDAAGFDGERWHVFDWKTDQCGEAEWASRVPRYQAQVDSYARMLADRYGQQTVGSIVRVGFP